MQVGYDVFVNVPALDARDGSGLQNVYDADELDFRLRPGSAAADRGMVLPTVTDDGCYWLTARAASRCWPPVLHGSTMPFVGS